MAQGSAEISPGVQSTYRLKCFEDYFPGISALVDRAQWGETRTMRETQTDGAGEAVKKNGRKSRSLQDVFARRIHLILVK